MQMIAELLQDTHHTITHILHVPGALHSSSCSFSCNDKDIGASLTHASHVLISSAHRRPFSAQRKWDWREKERKVHSPAQLTSLCALSITTHSAHSVHLYTVCSAPSSFLVPSFPLASRRHSLQGELPPAYK